MALTDLDNLEIYRGHQKIWTINTDLVLTSATIYFAVYATYPNATILDDTGALISKSTSDGITITDGAAGTFELTIDEADTYSLTITADPDYYVYSLKYVASGETETRAIGRGKFALYHDVARTT